MQLTNTRAIPITFSLEPWGDAHDMPPGATFELIARGPEGGWLDVEFGEDQITVWGWQDSVVNLYHEGEELGAGLWERPRVPPTPQNESNS